MKEEERYYEPIKTLNGYGVQLVVTGDKGYKKFIRRCFSEEEVNIVADKFNKELKNGK